MLRDCFSSVNFFVNMTYNTNKLLNFIFLGYDISTPTHNCTSICTAEVSFEPILKMEKIQIKDILYRHSFFATNTSQQVGARLLQVKRNMSTHLFICINNQISSLNFMIFWSGYTG